MGRSSTPRCDSPAVSSFSGLDDAVSAGSTASADCAVCGAVSSSIRAEVEAVTSATELLEVGYNDQLEKNTTIKAGLQLTRSASWPYAWVAERELAWL